MRKKLSRLAFFQDALLPLVVAYHPRIDGTIQLHGHTFHELILIYGGSGRHVMDEESYAIRTGDVYLIRGTMEHAYREVQELNLVNILYEPEPLALPVRDLRDIAGYYALFELEPRYRKLHGFQHRLRLDRVQRVCAAELIATLHGELDRRQPGCRPMAQALFVQLLVYLSRCYAASRHPGAVSLVRMSRVLDHMDRCYADTDLSLARLADLAHMSKSAFVRHFRAVTDRSPVDYLLHVRLHKAAEKLRQGEDRIVDVALSCGFNDSNYFTRQFTARMGLPPREFRKSEQS